jgi:hypothetical protein
VLRLGHRESVAGHDDDALRVGEHDCDVVGARRADGRAVRAGGGGALGAIIGGIAGGGKGAAIGAAIGAGAGVASTAIQGSSKVKLERGTEVLIRTTARPRSRR